MFCWRVCVQYCTCASMKKVCTSDTYHCKCMIQILLYCASLQWTVWGPVSGQIFAMQNSAILQYCDAKYCTKFCCNEPFEAQCLAKRRRLEQFWHGFAISNMSILVFTFLIIIIINVINHKVMNEPPTQQKYQQIVRRQNCDTLLYHSLVQCLPL